MYSYNVMGTQGPRKMMALVPLPECGSGDGGPATFKPEDGGHALIDRHACCFLLISEKTPHAGGAAFIYPGF